MLDTILRGAERDRTVDLRLAKPALSQLSYSPRWFRTSASAQASLLHRSRGLTPDRPRNKVGQGRLELPTSRLSGVRSNHLSYWPEKEPLGVSMEGTGARDAFPVRSFKTESHLLGYDSLGASETPE